MLKGQKQQEYSEKKKSNTENQQGKDSDQPASKKRGRPPKGSKPQSSSTPRTQLTLGENAIANRTRSKRPLLKEDMSIPHKRVRSLRYSSEVETSISLINIPSIPGVQAKVDTGLSRRKNKRCQSDSVIVHKETTTLEDSTSEPQVIERLKEDTGDSSDPEREDQIHLPDFRRSALREETSETPGTSYAIPAPSRTSKNQIVIEVTEVGDTKENSDSSNNSDVFPQEQEEDIVPLQAHQTTLTSEELHKSFEKFEQSIARFHEKTAGKSQLEQVDEETEEEENIVTRADQLTPESLNKLRETDPINEFTLSDTEMEIRIERLVRRCELETRKAALDAALNAQLDEDNCNQLQITSRDKEQKKDRVQKITDIVVETEVENPQEDLLNDNFEQAQAVAKNNESGDAD